MRMLLALSLLACGAYGQPSVWIDLSGEWRVHTTSDWLNQSWDRPEYAQPGFDDSQWPTLYLPNTGNRISPGFWLRRRVTLPEAARQTPLALTLGIPALSSYEVYLNGRLLGGTGNPVDLRDAVIPTARTFDIPRDFVPAKGDLLIALRAGAVLHMSPTWYLPDHGPYLLTSRTLAARDEGRVQLDRQHTKHAADLVMAGAFASAGLLAFLVWLGNRDRRDLLLLSLTLLAYALGNFYTLSLLVSGGAYFNRGGFAPLQIHSDLIREPLLACFALAAVSYSGAWRYALIWVCWSALPFSVFLLPGIGIFGVWFASLAGLLISAEFILRNWRQLRYSRAAQREDHFYRLLLLLILSLEIWEWTALMLDTEATFGPRAFGTPLGPYPTRLTDIGFAILMMVVMAAVFRRIAADRRQKRRLEQEVAAAKTVQELLIPPSSTPGVEAIYQPASEVGGDFYQVIPLNDSDLLVAVGDVSGKGLKAAMMVALIVGVLRNRNTDRPAEILRFLNSAVVGNTGGGFVTATIARVSAGGLIEIANAGHPSPYLGGRELSVSSGLPLGLDRDAGEYEVRQFLMAPGQTLTFVSDGVVEAANAKGELFGFERTAAISEKPAAEIAEAARAWGQNDDITVVTIRPAHMEAAA